MKITLKTLNQVWINNRLWLASMAFIRVIPDAQNPGCIFVVL